jgi:hypothetical protein
MKISDELRAKYNMAPLEEEKKIFGDTPNTVIQHYKTFLIQTDHVPIKIFENFIENMATASIAETIGVVISFFKDVKVTYAEVLAARKYAREEINRLEAEMAESEENTEVEDIGEVISK